MDTDLSVKQYLGQFQQASAGEREIYNKWREYYEQTDRADAVHPKGVDGRSAWLIYTNLFGHLKDRIEQNNLWQIRDQALRDHELNMSWRE